MSTIAPDSVPLVSTNSWSEVLARFGLLGKAVLHLVAGFLAVQLALDRSSGDAGSTGAVEWIGDQPWGTPVGVVLAASLAALAVWRATEVVTGDPVEGSAWHDRVTFAAKAVFYAGLAVLTIQAVRSPDGRSSSGGASGGTSTEATSTVFDLPAGRFLVLAAAGGVAAIAIVLLWHHAWRADFAERVEFHDGSPLLWLGRVGYGLRGVAYFAVSVFLADAAVSHDPQRAKSLGQSLRAIADTSWGPPVLVAIGVGFAAYGAFCVAESVYRRDA